MATKKPVAEKSFLSMKARVFIVVVRQYGSVRTDENSLRIEKVVCTIGTGGSMKKENIIHFTKYLLDFMYFAGILVTITLPFSIKWLGKYMENLANHYAETVIIYFVLGILAIAILGELRKIFRTVLADNCFVMENVVSLQRMGTYSFMIAAVSLVRSILYLTIAMAVVILVFVIAGLFSKVLAFVFERAVNYKEENDLTI